MVARYVVWIAGVSWCLACGPPADNPPGHTDTPQTSAGAALDATPPLPAMNQPLVVFLGTSLTAGLGVDIGEAFPALVQQRVDDAGLPFRIVNAGVSGETSAGARRRVDWVLGQGRVALLVVETGANDGLRGQDPDSLRANLEAIIAIARAVSPAPRILLVGMEALPNLGANYAARFRAVYPAVARATNVLFLPFLLEGVGGVDSLNQGDGIHPNPTGHRRIADQLWPALRPMLDSIAREESLRESRSR